MTYTNLAITKHHPKSTCRLLPKHFYELDPSSQQKWEPLDATVAQSRFQQWVLGPHVTKNIIDGPTVAENAAGRQTNMERHIRRSSLQPESKERL
jgi:hypothetical protein